jgi:hypothetical protein
MSTLVRLPGGGTAGAAYVSRIEAVPAAVASLDLPVPSPVLVLVGGANALTTEIAESLAPLFADVIAPAVRRHHAIAVDGGTDSGVMRLMGRALNGHPLVGVAALGTVSFPGHPGEPIADSAPLDPHHTHFVLVEPGREWGEDVPYIAAVASSLAGSAPSVTLLINGGDVSVTDAEESLAAGRPVLVVAGTGRTADKIAAAASDPAGCGDERLAAIAASPLVRVTALTDHPALAAHLAEALAG